MATTSAVPATAARRRPAAAAAFASVLALSVIAAAPADATGAGGWRRLASEGGIVVSIRDVPGRDVPQFKGVATIAADPLLLLAILADVDRACEWNAACVHARVVERRSEFDLVFHNRLRATWPVSDRDAVLRTQASIEADGALVRASFRAIDWPALRPAKGVVRFPLLHGRYEIRRTPKGGSHVVYEIDADPGGMIPAWFVQYAVKNVPLSTLAGLRRQAAQHGARYAPFVARHAGPAGAAP